MAEEKVSRIRKASEIREEFEKAYRVIMEMYLRPDMISNPAILVRDTSINVYSYADELRNMVSIYGYTISRCRAILPTLTRTIVDEYRRIARGEKVDLDRVERLVPSIIDVMLCLLALNVPSIDVDNAYRMFINSVIDLSIGDTSSYSKFLSTLISLIDEAVMDRIHDVMNVVDDSIKMIRDANTYIDRFVNTKRDIERMLEKLDRDLKDIETSMRKLLRELGI